MIIMFYFVIVIFFFLNFCLIIGHAAGAIICFVASVCVHVRLSVGTLLFEPFDL